MEWSIPYIRAMCDPWKYRQQRWSTDEEALMLHNLTRTYEVKNVVEIGTGYGFLSVCFAHAGATVQTFDRTDRPKVWTHENWPWPELNAKIIAKAIPSPECFEGLVVPPGRTLFFVDGDHTEAAVEYDIERVEVRMAPGDIMAVHDATGEVGPRRAWRRFLRSRHENAITDLWETKNGVGIYICE